MALIKCPECGKEVSDEAAACPHCGYELKKEDKKQKPGVIAYLIAIVILFGLPLYFMHSCIGSGDNTPRADIATEYDAYSISHEFIKSGLKAPSTAKWAKMSESKMTKLNETTWIVSSWVDSQNSFGAMLRTHYWTKVQYTGNGKWKLIDYELE